MQEGISKEEWKIEEDLLLLELIKKNGKKWRYLTQYFEGRTELQLKNRYKGTLKFLERKAITKT